MEWERCEPLEGQIKGCIHNYLEAYLPMDRELTVGFGEVSVIRDGEGVWRSVAYPAEKTAADMEEKAAADPDHDWRIRFNAPLSEAIYQRHGKAKWMLIAVGDGFA